MLVLGFGDAKGRARWSWRKTLGNASSRGSSEQPRVPGEEGVGRNFIGLGVNQNSRRCGAAEFDQAERGLSCRASQRSGCPVLPTFNGCLNFCTEQNLTQREFFPACAAESTAINVCTAGVAPTPASNWECFDGFTGFALGPCAAEYDALNTCFSTE